MSLHYKTIGSAVFAPLFVPKAAVEPGSFVDVLYLCQL